MESLSTLSNITDLSVLVLLFLGMASGVRHGLSGEFLRVLTFFFAILVGWKGTDAGAAWLAEQGNWPLDDVRSLAFFGLMLATYLALAIVRITLRLLMVFSFRGKVEYIGGALFGLLRAAVFCAIILLAISLYPFELLSNEIKASVSGRFVENYVRPLYDEIAVRNPDLNLPVGEIPPGVTPTAERPAEPLPALPPAGLDAPAYEPYLGPLIDESIDEQPE